MDCKTMVFVWDFHDIIKKPSLISKQIQNIPASKLVNLLLKTEPKKSLAKRFFMDIIKPPLRIITKSTVKIK